MRPTAHSANIGKRTLVICKSCDQQPILLTSECYYCDLLQAFNIEGCKNISFSVPGRPAFERDVPPLMIFFDSRISLEMDCNCREICASYLQSWTLVGCFIVSEQQTFSSEIRGRVSLNGSLNGCYLVLLIELHRACRKTT